MNREAKQTLALEDGVSLLFATAHQAASLMLLSFLLGFFDFFRESELTVAAKLMENGVMRVASSQQQTYEYVLFVAFFSKGQFTQGHYKHQAYFT